MSDSDENALLSGTICYTYREKTLNMCRISDKNCKAES